MANAPFFPTLNQIRSARRGELDGYAVAEALDQVGKAIKAINTQMSAKTSAPLTVVQPSAASASAGSASTRPSTRTVPSFADLTSGENDSAAMIVGTGASLSYTDAGIINASEIQGVAISGTPSAGWVPIALNGATAVWSLLGMITTLDCNSSVGLVGGLDCGVAA
jgi:hypothetical protein